MAETITTRTKITGGESRPIYPTIWIQNVPVYIEKGRFFPKRVLEKTHLRARTFIRMEHEGKWYLMEFCREISITANYEDDHENHLVVKDAVIRLQQQIYTEVYNYQINGMVCLAFKNIHGGDIFILDEHQISEKQRLQQLNK